MTREIIAYQRLSLDDAIDATELHAEAVLRGDGMIAQYKLGIDAKQTLMLLGAEKYFNRGSDTFEFQVYSHDFFKCADASEYEWKYEGSVIKFMCDIKKYFDMSGADVVYIHFR